MIRISDAAQAHFAKLLANQEEGTQIRVFVINPGTPNAECGVLIVRRMPWKPPTLP
ncbi:putative thioredoxin-like protein [Escherichia coli]|uniref:Putative thioredoxin-like protein n=1 Tax=Escherichia coli TaxID=562 RepID=A0A376TYW6_ECOLX|nr:putative thioredoxin-like protein [Escherichia coli]